MAICVAIAPITHHISREPKQPTYNSHTNIGFLVVCKRQTMYRHSADTSTTTHKRALASKCVRLLFALLFVIYNLKPLLKGPNPRDGAASKELNAPKEAPNDEGKLHRSLALLDEKARDNGSGIPDLFKSKYLDPLYIDIGLSDGKDTKFYLSRGYSTVSVDAFAPWIAKARENFETEIKQGRALFFNVGLSTKDDNGMKLFFKEPGSVIASFDANKGCQGLRVTDPKCLSVEVPVVRCDALFAYIGRPATIAKVDIEMLHHSCMRGLRNLPSSILPKTVCWEEHDKPFGPARIRRPITDVKLILLLSELGYSQVKLVLEGPRVHKYYGVSADKAGGGQQSGNLTPDEMMHYRSNEKKENESGFDNDWRSVAHVLQEGVFAPPKNWGVRGYYFDICMKLGPNAEKERLAMSRYENFPLFSTATDG